MLLESIDAYQSPFAQKTKFCSSNQSTLSESNVVHPFNWRLSHHFKPEKLFQALPIKARAKQSVKLVQSVLPSTHNVRPSNEFKLIFSIHAHQSIQPHPFHMLLDSIDAHPIIFPSINQFSLFNQSALNQSIHDHPNKSSPPNQFTPIHSLRFRSIVACSKNCFSLVQAIHSSRIMVRSIIWCTLIQSIHKNPNQFTLPQLFDYHRPVSRTYIQSTPSTQVFLIQSFQCHPGTSFSPNQLLLWKSTPANPMNSRYFILFKFN